MKTDIVIPIHDSPEDVRRCISSCVASLRAGDRIILVDDGSAPATENICISAAEKYPSSIVLVRHSEGRGFSRAANAGIGKTESPIVILLNSDTVVPPEWLDRIEACFASNPNIGIVGPLSNAGGWQSIPEIVFGGPKNNRIASDDVSLEKIQDFCRSFRDLYEYPVVDQINGFCIAIRREVFERIGMLDEKSFPKGYGEEVDFNFRAQDAGFISAIAIDCFVYHDKTKSYTPETRKELVAEGRARNDRVHGAFRVKEAMAGSRDNPILKAIRARAAQAFAKNGWMLDE